MVYWANTKLECPQARDRSYSRARGVGDWLSTQTPSEHVFHIDKSAGWWVCFDLPLRPYVLQSRSTGLCWFTACMSGHLSTVLPRGMRGTSRRASPTRSEQLSKDESSLGLPNDKVNTRLQNDEDTIRVMKDEGNTNLPKDEDTPRLPKDAGANSTHLSKDDDNARLPGHADNKPEVAVGKRRALLVGIRYNNPSNWDALDRPHGDVERYRILLTSA